MELSDKLLKQFKKNFSTIKSFNELIGKDGVIKKLMKVSLEKNGRLMQGFSV